jgi:hypothetical protein
MPLPSGHQHTWPQVFLPQGQDTEALEVVAGWSPVTEGHLTLASWSHVGLISDSF